MVLHSLDPYPIFSSDKARKRSPPDSDDDDDEVQIVSQTPPQSPSAPKPAETTRSHTLHSDVIVLSDDDDDSDVEVVESTLRSSSHKAAPKVASVIDTVAKTVATSGKSSSVQRKDVSSPHSAVEIASSSSTKPAAKKARVLSSTQKKVPVASSALELQLVDLDEMPQEFIRVFGEDNAYLPSVFAFVDSMRTVPEHAMAILLPIGHCPTAKNTLQGPSQKVIDATPRAAAEMGVHVLRIFDVRPEHPVHLVPRHVVPAPRRADTPPQLPIPIPGPAHPIAIDPAPAHPVINPHPAVPVHPIIDPHPPVLDEPNLEGPEVDEGELDPAVNPEHDEVPDGHCAPLTAAEGREGQRIVDWKLECADLHLATRKMSTPVIVQIAGAQVRTAFKVEKGDVVWKYKGRTRTIVQCAHYRLFADTMVCSAPVVVAASFFANLLTAVLAGSDFVPDELVLDMFTCAWLSFAKSVAVVRRDVGWNEQRYSDVYASFIKAEDVSALRFSPDDDPSTWSGLQRALESALVKCGKFGLRRKSWKEFHTPSTAAHTKLYREHQAAAARAGHASGKLYVLTPDDRLLGYSRGIGAGTAEEISERCREAGRKSAGRRTYEGHLASWAKGLALMDSEKRAQISKTKCANQIVKQAAANSATLSASPHYLRLSPTTLEACRRRFDLAGITSANKKLTDQSLFWYLFPEDRKMGKNKGKGEGWVLGHHSRFVQADFDLLQLGVETAGRDGVVKSYAKTRAIDETTCAQRDAITAYLRLHPLPALPTLSL